MTDGFTRPGKLYLYDGIPAWNIHVPQPSRFRHVKTTLEFRAFRLPGAGVLACILRLFDVPEQPFYVHRAFDPGDPGVSDYLAKSQESLLWVVELRGSGEDPGCVRLLALKDSGFLECHAEVQKHNRSLGTRLDGAGALKEFLMTFEPASKEGGWEAGWEAVGERFTTG